MTAIYKKYILRDVGPGGWGCHCCAPAPGDPERRMIAKRGRRKADALAIEEGLLEYELRDEFDWNQWIEDDMDTYSSQIMLRQITNHLM